MLTGLDLSNLQNHPDTWPSQPWYPQYQAADFCIVQALEPPPGYPGHDFIDPETGKRGYTGVALRQAQRDGKKVGVYAWLWNGLADTRSNILSRLATVPPSVRLDMRPWVDAEDTTGAAFMTVINDRGPGLRRQLQCEARPEVQSLRRLLPSSVSAASRMADVLAARSTADSWAVEKGCPPSGGYSGQWYQDGYLNGWWPDGWPKWWAAYGITPGSLIGGLVVAHQYTSTPVDQNVMLESEIVSGGSDVNCDTYKAALERAVNRLQIELAKKTAPSKKILREISSELFQALQA